MPEHIHLPPGEEEPHAEQPAATPAGPSVRTGLRAKVPVLSTHSRWAADPGFKKKKLRHARPDPHRPRASRHSKDRQTEKKRRRGGVGDQVDHGRIRQQQPPVTATQTKQEPHPQTPPRGRRRIPTGKAGNQHRQHPQQKRWGSRKTAHGDPHTSPRYERHRPPREAGTGNRQGRRRTTTPDRASRQNWSGTAGPTQNSSTIQPGKHQPASGETQTGPHPTRPPQERRRTKEAPTHTHHLQTRPRRGSLRRDHYPGTSRNPQPRKAGREQHPYPQTNHQPRSPHPNARAPSLNLCTPETGATHTHPQKGKPRPGPEEGRRKPQLKHVPNPNPEPGEARTGKATKPSTRATQQ